jgi:peptide methionine sulfoxide reductase MsrB
MMLSVGTSGGMGVTAILERPPTHMTSARPTVHCQCKNTALIGQYVSLDAYPYPANNQCQIEGTPQSEPQVRKTPYFGGMNLSSAELLNSKIAEWCISFGPEAHDVLPREGTEHADFSSINTQARLGVVRCAGCGLPHLSSEIESGSGAGCRGFVPVIPGALVNRKAGMWHLPRIEQDCMRGSRQRGPLVENGPEPT